MRVRVLGVLMVVGAVMRPAVGLAIDPPHDKNSAKNNDGNVACHYCHSLFVESVSGAQDFSSACIGCHNVNGQQYGVPWAGSDEAVPGVTGLNHSHSGPIVSPAHGSANKLLTEDQHLLVDGKLQCAVCHDPHSHGTNASPDSMHTSFPVGAGQPKTGTVNTDATGNAQLTLNAVQGSASSGFRVQVRSVDGDGLGGTIIVSHTYGYDPARWVTWNGTWVAGVATDAGKPFDNGVYVDLDVAGISVKLTGGAKVGDYWDFYVGYPFLRLTNVEDFACVRCHAERAMNHLRARGLDRYYLPNGVRKFSHPVGDGLNANGFGSDRARVLDVDGTQVTDVEGKVGTSTSDAEDGLANATNDLVLKNGIVRCTTCHAAHNADSNSYTRDAR